MVNWRRTCFLWVVEPVLDPPVSSKRSVADLAHSVIWVPVVYPVIDWSSVVSVAPPRYILHGHAAN